MTSRRAEDLPRQIAQLRRQIEELNRLASRQGHDHGFLLLAQATASGSSVTLAVADIPQAHRDLLVLFHGSHAGTANQNLTARFNNDTGSNYRWVRVDADDNAAPTRVSNNAGTSLSLGVIGDDASVTSVKMVVHSYATTRNHGAQWQTYGSQGVSAGNSRYTDGAGAWVSNTAVTSIQIISTTDNISSGSTLRVYGLGLI